MSEIKKGDIVSFEHEIFGRVVARFLKETDGAYYFCNVWYKDRSDMYHRPEAVDVTVKSYVRDLKRLSYMDPDYIVIRERFRLWDILHNGFPKCYLDAEGKLEDSYWYDYFADFSWDATEFVQQANALLSDIIWLNLNMAVRIVYDVDFAEEINNAIKFVEDCTSKSARAQDKSAWIYTRWRTCI